MCDIIFHFPRKFVQVKLCLIIVMLGVHWRFVWSAHIQYLFNPLINLYFSNASQRSIIWCDYCNKWLSLQIGFFWCFIIFNCKDRSCRSLYKYSLELLIVFILNIFFDRTWTSNKNVISANTFINGLSWAKLRMKWNWVYG